MWVILSFVTQPIGIFPSQRIACSLSFPSVFMGWPGSFKRLTRMSLKWSKVSLRLDPTTFSFPWKHIVRRSQRAAWKQFHGNRRHIWSNWMLILNVKIHNTKWYTTSIGEWFSLYDVHIWNCSYWLFNDNNVLVSQLTNHIRRSRLEFELFFAIYSTLYNIFNSFKQ